jgi:predicted dehydrogenase
MMLNVNDKHFLEATMTELIQNATPLGWGFLGTGSISATVAKELKVIGQGRLAAVYGRDIERTRAFAAEHDFAVACKDIEAVLREDAVDAVYIALPHSLHIDCILAALDAGKHVLCEKPLGMNKAEVRRVMAHPRGASCVVSEGFMVRHHPQWRWILDSIAAGAIGKVRGVQAHSCLPFAAPAHPPRLPGESSLLLDIGCYSVHLARAIFRAEPEKVSARMDYDEGGHYDVRLSAQLDFPAGQAHLFVATGMRPARRLHILGSGGSIEVFNPVQPSPAGTATVRLIGADGAMHEEVFAHAPQYALQFQDFAQAVTRGRPPLVPLGDALGNAIALDAIRISAAAEGALVLTGQ